jgi:hypothetical protein
MSDRYDRASAGAAADGAARRGVLAEFLDAARAAVVAVLDEQKERAADRVAAVGEAVRRAGQPLDPEAMPRTADFARRTAEEIDAFSAAVRARSWEELAADTAAFARRRPALFVAGAAALGFVAGRLIAGPGAPAPPASDRTRATADAGEEPAAAYSGGAPGVP